MGKDKNRRQPSDRGPRQPAGAVDPSGDRGAGPSGQEPAQSPRGKRQKRFGHN